MTKHYRYNQRGLHRATYKAWRSGKMGYNQWWWRSGH